MKILNTVIYALIALIIVFIVFMVFVQFDFRDFVQELEGRNLYLYEEQGKILFGFESKPYSPLTGEEIGSINMNLGRKGQILQETGSSNIIIYTPEALEDKEVGEVEFIERIYTKEEAAALLDSTELSLESKNNIFASLAEEFHSEYFFRELRKGSIIVFPDRLFWSFIMNCPESFTAFFEFQREVA